MLTEQTRSHRTNYIQSHKASEISQTVILIYRSIKAFYGREFNCLLVEFLERLRMLE